MPTIRPDASPDAMPFVLGETYSITFRRVDGLTREVIGIMFAASAIRELRAKNRPEIDAESRAYKTWLDTIPGARLIVTHDSGHNVPIEQPQLVVETIREVVRPAGDRPRQ